MDPGFASARVGLSQTYIWDALYYGVRAFGEATGLAEDEARRALTIDPNDFSGTNSFSVCIPHGWELQCGTRSRRAGAGP